MPTVKIDFLEGVFHYEPASHLGPRAFDAFLSATEPCHRRKVTVPGFEMREKWITTSSVDVLSNVVDACLKSGIDITLTDGAEAAMEAWEEQRHRDESSAKKQLTLIEKCMKLQGLKLYPYQSTGSLFLSGRRKGFFADQMGLGKTVVSLAAISPDQGVVVVCPASLQVNWLLETKKWRPELAPYIPPSFVYPNPGQIIITTFDKLPEAPPPSALPFTLIADEAHRLKNPATGRTKKFVALRDVAMKHPASRLWMLTGTPMLNRPQELWSLLKVADLEREAFGSKKSFNVTFNAKVEKKRVMGGKFLEVASYPNEPLPEAASKLARVALRRLRADVLPELPTKTYRAIPVEATVTDVKTISALYEEFVDAVQPTKLPKFDEFSRELARLALSKIKSSLKLIEEYEEQQEPLLFFSAYKAPIALVGARAGWGVITGDVSPTERARLVEEFMGGRLLGLAGTIGAMGVGLTLTRAAHVLFNDRSFVPAENLQAEDRACRLGQTRGVVITDIIADHPLERRIYELLMHKQRLIAVAVDGAKT